MLVPMFRAAVKYMQVLVPSTAAFCRAKCELPFGLVVPPDNTHSARHHRPHNLQLLIQGEIQFHQTGKYIKLGNTSDCITVHQTVLLCIRLYYCASDWEILRLYYCVFVYLYWCTPTKYMYHFVVFSCMFIAHKAKMLNSHKRLKISVTKFAYFKSVTTSG